MVIWIVIIVSGICTLFSFYMSFLAFKNNDSSVFFIRKLRSFLGIQFVISVIKAFWKKKVEELAPVRFVPHWFMMMAITIIALVILISIAMSIIRALR